MLTHYVLTDDCTRFIRQQVQFSLWKLLHQGEGSMKGCTPKRILSQKLYAVICVKAMYYHYHHHHYYHYYNYYWY